MNKITVVVADDMKEIRNLFKTMFKNNSEIEIIGEADCGSQAYDVASELKPDIVLMDIEMENKYSGIEATKQINENLPDVKVIILTMHDDDEVFINSYAMGAKAFLLKNSTEEKIVETIRNVYDGKYMLDEIGAKKVINKLSQYASERHSLLFVMNMLSALTKSEMEILKSIYAGKSYKDITQERYIEKKTLENHITSILKKFNAKSIRQLISELKELRIFDNNML